MVIGFSSFGSSGKSTAAQILHAILSPNVTTINFSDPMKRFAEEFGFNKETLYGPSQMRTGKNHLGLECRTFLQSLGDWGRAQHPDFYVDRAIRTIRTHAGWEPTTGWSYVLPDHRYANEMTTQRDTVGGKLIRVRREGVETSTVTGGMPGHSSETEMEIIPDSFFDLVIEVPEFEGELPLRFFLWDTLRKWATKMGLIEEGRIPTEYEHALFSGLVHHDTHPA